MARKRTITNPVTDSAILSAIVRAELQTIHNEIIQGQSIFGAFGGDGNQGAITVSSATNVSSIDDSNRAGVIQCSSFELTSGNTLTVDTGWLFLGCTGTVTIAGTIDANGKGEPGAAQGSGTPGTPSGWFDASVIPYDSYADVTGGGQSKIAEKSMYYCFPVPFSVAGASGAGGRGAASGKNYRFHMPGGGAGGLGGVPVYGSSASAGPAASATPTAKIIALTGGLGDNSVKGYSHFNPLILMGRGAGGAGAEHSSGFGGAGGNGGGNIYIECNELIFTGTLRANGSDGTAGDGFFGGGGGGGGVILVRAKTITTNSGSVTVTAGNGGSGSSASGGAGAAGFKQIIQVLD